MTKRFKLQKGIDETYFWVSAFSKHGSGGTPAVAKATGSNSQIVRKKVIKYSQYVDIIGRVGSGHRPTYALSTWGVKYLNEHKQKIIEKTEVIHTAHIGEIPVGARHEIPQVANAPLLSIPMDDRNEIDIQPSMIVGVDVAKPGSDSSVEIQTTAHVLNIVEGSVDLTSLNRLVHSWKMSSMIISDGKLVVVLWRQK